MANEGSRPSRTHVNSHSRRKGRTRTASDATQVSESLVLRCKVLMLSRSPRSSRIIENLVSLPTRQRRPGVLSVEGEAWLPTRMPATWLGVEYAYSAAARHGSPLYLSRRSVTNSAGTPTVTRN